MKASDLLIKSLENEGVEYIFTVPGEETLDLMESIRTSQIQLIVLRHEQVAGFMAATYGRLTGKPGVCLVTLGPGATNLMTAIAHAQLGGMPMIAITGQKPIKKKRQGKFQVVDVIQMMQPLTKSTKTIIHPHTIPALIREAFHLAQEASPGVVHLEFPEDVAKESSHITHPLPVTPLYKPYANLKAIQKAIQMIEKAKCPLLMIGAGASPKNHAKILAKFIEKIDLPFFNTQMGKGIVNEHHPRFLGTAALSEGDLLHKAIDHADLIINIGHHTIEKPPFLMTEKSAKVIHINPHPAEINEVYFPQLEVIGHIPHTLEALIERIKEKPRCNLSYYDMIKKHTDQHIQTLGQDNQYPISPPRLVKDIQHTLPKDTILAFDNGMYKIWFARNYRTHQKNTFLLDNALATMGAGLPAGMAAKLLHPNRKVIVITGDGGFLMSDNALASAIDLQLNLVILILRDDGYGMIKWKQEQMNFPNYGLEFGNPDFVKYAEAHGAFATRINTIETLPQTLLHCLAQNGISLIEVPINYTQNTFMLGRELKKYVAKITKT